MIRVFCTCGRAFKAEDRHAGKHTKCPECGADLTIGPVPASSSSGGDVDEVPSWWYPSEPAGADTRATAPTQSRSDPGADGVSTVVLPPGRNAKAGPQGSSDSQPTTPSGGSRIPPANSTIGFRERGPVRASFPVKNFGRFPEELLWRFSPLA